jgi:hypothetical protein
MAKKKKIKPIKDFLKAQKRKQPKRPRGKPPYEPNKMHREMIKVFRAAGFTEKETAKKIGICYNTLRKYYPEELANAKRDWEFIAVRGLLDHVSQKNLNAIRFYLMCQCGWTPTQKHEILSPPDPKEAAQRAAELEAEILKAHEGDGDEI